MERHILAYYGDSDRAEVFDADCSKKNVSDLSLLCTFIHQTQQKWVNFGACALGCCVNIDKHYLAAISEGRILDIYQIRSTNVKRLFRNKSIPAKDAATTLASSIDGSFLAVGTRDGCIYLWMPFAEGKILGMSKTHFKAVSTIAFNDNGTVFATGSEDCTICIWNTCSFSRGKPLTTLTIHNLPLTCARFSRGGFSGYLFTSSLDSTVKVVDLSNFTCISTISFESPVTFILVGPPDSNVHCGCEDGTIINMRADDGSIGSTKKLIGHKGRITHLASTDNGRNLISASFDKSIRIWDVLSPSQQPVSTVEAEYPVSGIANMGAGDDIPARKPAPLKKHTQDTGEDYLEIAMERGSALRVEGHVDEYSRVRKGFRYPENVLLYDKDFADRRGAELEKMDEINMANVGIVSLIGDKANSARL